MLIRPLEEKVEKLAGFKVDLCIKIDQVHIELKKLKKGKVTNAVYVCVCLEEVIVTTAIIKIMTALAVCAYVYACSNKSLRQDIPKYGKFVQRRKVFGFA